MLTPSELLLCAVVRRDSPHLRFTERLAGRGEVSHRMQRKRPSHDRGNSSHTQRFASMLTITSNIVLFLPESIHYHHTTHPGLCRRVTRRFWWRSRPSIWRWGAPSWRPMLRWIAGIRCTLELTEICGSPWRIFRSDRLRMLRRQARRRSSGRPSLSFLVASPAALSGSRCCSRSRPTSVPPGR